MSADSDAAGLLRSMTALVRQRYQLGDVEATAYVVDMPNRIRELEAENAVLRARAVPELRLNRMGVAESGQFTGCVADNGDWALGMYLKGILISIEDGTGGKTAMDATFLRLVGVQNG